MSPDAIEQLVRKHFEVDAIEVLMFNQATVQWFSEVAGLMRMTMLPSGHALYQGADWTQIEARRRLSRRRVTPEQIEGLDTMATAYCQTLNEGST